MNSIFVDGKINNKPVRITVDTGATHSLIRSDLAKEREPIAGMQLRTATGDAAPIYGKITGDLTLGTITKTHEFVVADIVDEVILGVDFLMKYKVSIDLARKLMIYKDIEVILNIEGDSEWKVNQIMLATDYEIPPKSESVIWADLKCKNKTNGVCIVEADNEEPLNNIIVGKSLVQVQTNKQIPVRILNLSPISRKIKKGTIIGRVNQVSCVINCESTEKASQQHEYPVIDSALKEVINKWSQELTTNQRERVTTLLNKFKHLFAWNGSSKGKTTLVKHQINTGDAKPIRQVPRRVPLAKREVAEKLIREMNRDGVIEPSSSPWSSPVVLVQKKDGSTRFCVDYRKLNSITKKDSFPLPRIDDTLDTLAGSTWFSTLDLQSGYWQVEIDEKDKEKTAFSIGSGLWQFKVMPFGLCNAPATFERLMEHVLHGLHWRSCLVYLDDIIVMGKDFNSHLDNLTDIFRRLEAAGLKLNPKKCEFFRKEVKYLGHKITAEGVQTDEDKIKHVAEWPRPRNVHELRSFLGLCTYYRRFVQGFANIAHPLHALTQKNKPFKWGDEQEKAFMKLKKELCVAPILAYPVQGEQFILDTDASNFGIGGVLSQVVNGEEKVIAYYSTLLAKPERNYCVTRKELLAIVKSVKQFHKYLYGQKFRLRTDHAALRWLLQFKNPEGQIARWIERLQNYDFDIEHRKGGKHGNADALSRRPCAVSCKHCNRVEEKEGLPDIRTVQFLEDEEWSADKIKIAQKQDEDLTKIIDAKQTNMRPSWEEISTQSQITKAYWAQWSSLQLINGCLYRVWESEDGKTTRKLLIVPKSKQHEVLKECHDGTSGGHLGINKTVDKIKQRFYWVGCQQTVVDWVNKCQVCMNAKGPKTRSRGKMQQYNVGAPFERVAMDIAGPFPVSNSGNRYVLVVIDYFSKWPEVYPMKSQEAETCADVFFKEWICRFGVPLELHSDQGRNFESGIFKELCRTMGIRKTRTTPLHPQSDGMVERFNRTLEEHLKKVVDAHQQDWDERIPKFLFAYRSATHDTISSTPAKAVFGNELRLPVDLKYGSKPNSNSGDQSSEQQWQELNEVHRQIRSNLQLKSDKMKARYDIRANSSGFNEGDLVMFYNPQRKKGLSPKLQTHWEGPYKVIKRINDVVYRIQWASKPRSKLKVVHLERLATYKGDCSTFVRDEQN